MQSGIQTLNAQVYQPMPTLNGTWSSVRCWYFYPGGWHDEYNVSVNGSDTLFNSHVYTKLFLQTHHAPGTQFDSVYSNFLGGMREVNKKIYFFSDYLCNDTIERLIYDFSSTTIGDTIRTQALSNFTLFMDHIVVASDSILIGGLYHHRITLADTNGIPWETWTEGLGSSLGLPYASYYFMSDNSYDLTCFRVKEQVLYSNPTPYYAYCTSPLPNIVCDSLTNSIQPIAANHSGVYPNPSSSLLMIDPSYKFHEVRILNAIGKTIIDGIQSLPLDIRELSSGTYFLQCLAKSGEVLSVHLFIKK